MRIAVQKPNVHRRRTSIGAFADLLGNHFLFGLQFICDRNISHTRLEALKTSGVEYILH